MITIINERYKTSNEISESNGKTGKDEKFFLKKHDKTVIRLDVSDP